MHRVYALLLASLVRLLLAAVSAMCTPVPPLDVPSLTRDADLIVIGKVIDVREEARGNYEIGGTLMLARLTAARFRVDRVLKGSAGNELSFTFLVPCLPVGYEGVAGGQFGMFFLRSTSGRLVFASPYHPLIVAAQEGCATEGDDLARVVDELGCVVQSHTATVRDRSEAIQALSTIRTAPASDLLRSAMRELPAPFSVLAAAFLIDRNDISALPIIEQAVRKSSLLVVDDYGYRLEINLGTQLWNINDPDAIPALVRLMEAVQPEVRRGAVEALRHTGSEAAIKPLSKALYDSDWEVRWVAVMGLAEITHQNSWYPAYDGFKQNEKRYLDYWREWARTRD